MKRYERIIISGTSGGTNGELNNYKVNSYSANYVDPPILMGYKYICGEWNNGFVIERCSDGSQFVWIPVGSLISNGTLNGVSFTEKFGRRNLLNNIFSEKGFHERMTVGFRWQQVSVMKHGGFYISRYNISKNKKTGKPQSVKGIMPWVYINCSDAKKVASTMEDNQIVKSHLTFGSEYDSVAEWFIESNARTRSEIVVDSTNWGNYLSNKNSPKRVVETGSSEKWCTNNIYDFAGNVDEWTQECYYNNSFRVIRGGNDVNSGNLQHAFYRNWSESKYSYGNTGFRTSLWLK